MWQNKITQRFNGCADTFFDCVCGGPQVHLVCTRIARVSERAVEQTKKDTVFSLPRRGDAKAREMYAMIEFDKKAQVMYSQFASASLISPRRHCMSAELLHRSRAVIIYSR